MIALGIVGGTTGGMLTSGLGAGGGGAVSSSEIFSCTNIVEPITYSNAPGAGTEGTPSQRSRVVLDLRNTSKVYCWCIASVAVNPTVGTLRWDIASSSVFSPFVVLAETNFGEPVAGVLAITPIDDIDATYKIQQAFIRCMATGNGVTDPVIQKAGLVFTKA